MKKVIGYVRVSSQQQIEVDNSIKNQKQRIIDFCKRMDYDLVEIYEDKGISGLKSNRDGLNQLLDRVKHRNIEGVIVYSLSRLGRKLQNVIEWVEILQKNNIEFVSIKENFNVNEIYGKLMLNILGSLNQFEVSVLGERISDVKQYKKSKREVYGGKILYGFYRRGDKLIINPKEIETLKTIDKLRNKDNLSYNKISIILNNQNIPSKEKGKWYPSSVRSVLNNKVLDMVG